jgi:hypothetical protein
VRVGQITPRVLTDALAAGGDETKRAFDAMMGMKRSTSPQSRRRGAAEGLDPGCPFGSLADIAARWRHVRFTPDSGRAATR